MRTEPFDFFSARGDRLSGRLDLPDGAPHAYALFAHCFTCDKTVRAAVRVSRALAAEGVAVLRFDFTGLGDSEGDFGAGGFGSNVDDVVSACEALARSGRPVSLLVGHSFGGAAVLAAAARTPGVRAVAVIGAPFDPEHVLHNIRGDLKAVDRDGSAVVAIGRRSFTLQKAFLDDLRQGDPAARIRGLGAALLVLHAPLDEVVSIDNASQIFTAALHPKSFVSLDRADHLLHDPQDGEYVARVIAGWSSRYLPLAAPLSLPARPAEGVVEVEETGHGDFQVEVRTSAGAFLADEPASVGGGGSGPSPYELASAALGACTAMTLRLYARRKTIPMAPVRVAVTHAKEPGNTPPDLFTRTITLDPTLSADQRERLMQIADRCPVHRTLSEGARVQTTAAEMETVSGPLEIGDHMGAMEQVCGEA